MPQLFFLDRSTSQQSLHLGNITNKNVCFLSIRKQVSSLFHNYLLYKDTKEIK